MTYQSIKPNTGKLLNTFEHLTEAQLEKSPAVADNGVFHAVGTVLMPKFQWPRSSNQAQALATAT